MAKRIASSSVFSNASNVAKTDLSSDSLPDQRYVSANLVAFRDFWLASLFLFSDGWTIDFSVQTFSRTPLNASAAIRFSRGSARSAKLEKPDNSPCGARARSPCTHATGARGCAKRANSAVRDERDCNFLQRADVEIVFEARS